jgi:hypothetical protein
VTLKEMTIDQEGYSDFEKRNNLCVYWHGKPDKYLAVIFPGERFPIKVHKDLSIELFEVLYL